MFTDRLRTIRKRSFEWSAILNPVSNEMAKREVVDKIVEAFPITASEAEELIERTPLILLESLSEQDATRLKNYFARANVDLTISNDQSIRKRCYRTVWPEQPSLDFLKFEDDNGHAEDVTADIKESAEMTQTVDDRKESAIRPPKEKFFLHDEPPAASGRSAVDFEKEDISIPSREEVEDRRHRSVLPETAPAAVTRDYLIDELKEKLVTVQKKVDDLTRANIKLEQALSDAQKTKADRLTMESMEQFRRSFDSMSLEQEKQHALMEEKVERLEEERDRLSASMLDMRTAVSKADADKNKLLGQQDEMLNTISQKERELEQLRLTAKRDQYAAEENRQLRHRSEQLMRQNEELSRTVQTVEDQKRSLESRVAQISDELTRLRREFETEFERLRKECDQLAVRNKDLEAKAAESQRLQEELKVARTRLEEFTVNREQQEAIQKRLRLQNELIEKEARLKELVKKQEIIEREIVERGQVIKQVLAEQEEIERDLVRAKQAQKYLIEQIKSREKTRFRSRGRIEVKSPEAASEPQPQEV